MSLKNGPDALFPSQAAPSTKAWSLAARLTAWYSASAFVLVLAATGFLYWALVSNLDREDDQLLGDRVRALRVVMLNRPGDAAAIRQEVDEEWEAHERTRVHMRVIDEGGKVLGETPGMGELLPSSSFPAPSSEPGAGRDVRSTSTGSYRVLVVSVPDPSRHLSTVIQVAMDRSLEIELLENYRRDLTVVLGTALIFCAAVGYGIARRGIRPIHQVTDTARRIRPSNLGERITLDGLPAELLLLAHTFNQMLDRLEQAFTRLSRFSADVAHELRTPVSNLRGEVEVALCKPRTLEEYQEILGSSLEECTRLAHLIDRLMFLARAEDPQMQIVKETFDLGEELATVCDFYEAAATEAGVGLHVAVTGQVLADVDRPLFQRALGNLVANALAHVSRGGTVTLAASGNGTATTVEVADTGTGIPATHLPHVFDRFYRVDAARSSPTGNVGLGLAIVKSIVELHGGVVQITSDVGRGTRVIMSFPGKISNG